MANKKGRPPKFETVKEIDDKVEQYFEACKGKVLKDVDGNPVLNKYGLPVIIDASPPTVTGLALALGFTSRRQMLEYQAKPGFHNTITRAKSKVEEYAESRLFDREGANGAQFSLRCNFGWSDKPVNDDTDGVQIIDNY